MTSLYGVIPPLMAWGLQNSSNNLEEGSHDRSMSRLLGDRATLATVGACATAIIVGQVMLDIFPPSPVVVAKFDHQEIQITPTSSDANAIFTTLGAP